MKKNLLVVVMLVVLIAAAVMSTLMFTACSSAKDDIKIGLITLHDENSTYDKNFIDAMNVAVKELGLKEDQLIIKSNIEESNACYEAAADLVDQGCNIIFADSFGHEDFLLKAAKEFTDVQFYHATGTQAAGANLANFHNAFAAIYEGRYLAGVVAGLKLKAMVDAGTVTTKKVGYVAAHPYAEVISGYTSWFLGVQSVAGEDVTMEVTYTNSWYDTDLEKQAANKLINNGCVLISQHADSWGAPTACETANVPNVSYNGSTVSKCPNTYLVSSKINWATYFKKIVNDKIAGKATEVDFVGTIADDSVQLADLGTACVDGTAAKVAEVKTALANGTLKVFDCAKFTVQGAHLTSYTNSLGMNGAECIVKEGDTYYFAESSLRSAPYFDMIIDGITVIS